MKILREEKEHAQIMITSPERAAIYYRFGTHTQIDNDAAAAAEYESTNMHGSQNGAAEPRRAAIYTRSATYDQTDDSHLPVQLEVCREYCFEHGYTLQEKHIYQDIGSGSEYKARPQLTALKEAAGDHEIDVVVVYGYDRLSRNHLHLALIIGEIEQLGIDVESVSDPAEEDIIGTLLRCAYDIAQQIEREKIIERMKRGRESARRRRGQ